MAHFARSKAVRAQRPGVTAARRGHVPPSLCPLAIVVRFGRVAQWESARFTRERSQVQYLPRPPHPREEAAIRERIGDLAVLHVPARGTSKRGPLVLQHGLWGGAWIFERWMEPAADRGWDVWAVSLRGREGSRPVDDLGAVRLEEFARDLAEALEAIGPAAVVGYSMGGLLLQMVTADPSTRELVRAAVLLCSLAPRGIPALSGPVLRASWRYLPAMLGSRAFLPNRSDADAMLLNDVPPEERDHWYPSFVPDSGRAARQIAVGSVSVDPASITCPVLVVSARDDHISPPAIQPKLVARYGAGHLALASHAHLVTIEPGWESVAAAVLDRLGSPCFPQPD